MSETNLKKLLGKRIKNLRKSKNLTQEKLAEMVGIGTANISYFETGKFVPSIDTIQKIAAVLNVEIYELYMFDLVRNEEEIKEELINVIKNNEKLRKKIYEYYLCIK